MNSHSYHIGDKIFLYPLSISQQMFSVTYDVVLFIHTDLSNTYLLGWFHQIIENIITPRTLITIKYNHLCFGVKAATGTSQKLIDFMLAALDRVAPYSVLRKESTRTISGRYYHEYEYKLHVKSTSCETWKMWIFFAKNIMFWLNFCHRWYQTKFVWIGVNNRRNIRQ